MSLVVIQPSAEFQVQSTTKATITDQPSGLKVLEQQFINWCEEFEAKFSESPIENFVNVNVVKSYNEIQLNIAELERESGIGAEFYSMLNEHIVDDTIEYLDGRSQIHYDNTFLLVNNKQFN